MDTLTLPTSEIADLARHALRNAGVSEADSQIVLDHVITCEEAGRASHGIWRVAQMIKLIRKHGLSQTAPTLERDEPSAVLLNGQGRLGLVIAERITRIAIERVQQQPIVLIGGFNFIATTGAMGIFARQIAEAGFLSLLTCTSIATVAPWGARRSILGTNPITIGVPSAGEPLISDLATSAWSYGAIEQAKRANRPLPEGVILDNEGRASTNPNDEDEGTMLPMAGHKGYALALALELLAGPLVHAKAGREAVKGSYGMTIIALNPAVFTPIDIFRTQTSALLDEVRSAPLAEGFEQVQIPGEQSRARQEASKQRGTLTLPKSVVDDLRALV